MFSIVIFELAFDFIGNLGNSIDFSVVHLTISMNFVLNKLWVLITIQFYSIINQLYWKVLEIKQISMFTTFRYSVHLELFFHMLKFYESNMYMTWLFTISRDQLQFKCIFSKLLWNLPENLRDSSWYIVSESSQRNSIAVTKKMGRFLFWKIIP